MGNTAIDPGAFTATDPVFSCADQTISCISLFKFVNRIISDSITGPAAPADVLINDVPADMVAGTHKEILSAILIKLFKLAAVNDRDNIIHVSAKLIGNVCLIHVRSNLSKYNEQIVGYMAEVVPLAEMLGGCAILTNNRVYGLNFAFTFYNH